LQSDIRFHDEHKHGDGQQLSGGDKSVRRSSMCTKPLQSFEAKTEDDLEEKYEEQCRFKYLFKPQ